MDRALEELLEAASQAEPGTRITFRDRIAAHGTDAIEPMERWLADRTLGAFAVRVLARIAKGGDPWAVYAALERGRPLIESKGVARDLDTLHTALRPRIEVLDTLRWMRERGTRSDGTDWTRKDADRLIAKMRKFESRPGFGRRSHTDAQSLDALRELQFIEFDDEPYLSHCWNCPRNIDSDVDARCDRCRRFFFCGSCGSCACDRPR